MKHNIFIILTMCLSIMACAGMEVPFSSSDHRIARSMIKTSDNEANTDCISFETFKMVGQTLEAAHIRYLSNENDVSYPALTRNQVTTLLGVECEERITNLTTEEIKYQLFGGLQSIPNPERLQRLGGILFKYRDTHTLSGIRPTLHLEEKSNGPLRGLVAIYNLENGQVLHLVYSGTDNVDTTDLTWAVLKFFGVIAKSASKAVSP